MIVAALHVRCWYCSQPVIVANARFFSPSFPSTKENSLDARHDVVPRGVVVLAVVEQDLEAGPLFRSVALRYHFVNN